MPFCNTHTSANTRDEPKWHLNQMLSPDAEDAHLRMLCGGATLLWRRQVHGSLTLQAADNGLLGLWRRAARTVCWDLDAESVGCNSRLGFRRAAVCCRAFRRLLTATVSVSRDLATCICRASCLTKGKTFADGKEAPACAMAGESHARYGMAVCVSQRDLRNMSVEVRLHLAFSIRAAAPPEVVPH